MVSVRFVVHGVAIMVDAMVERMPRTLGPSNQILSRQTIGAKGTEPVGLSLIGARIRGTLGDRDPLDQAPVKRAISRVKKGHL